MTWKVTPAKPNLAMVAGSIPGELTFNPPTSSERGGSTVTSSGNGFGPPSCKMVELDEKGVYPSYTRDRLFS